MRADKASERIAEEETNTKEYLFMRGVSFIRDKEDLREMKNVH